MLQEKLPSPFAIPTPQSRTNMDLWCEYHKEHGHTLPNCREWKRILNQYAEEGKLKLFLYRGSSGRRYNSENRENRKPEPEIKSKAKENSSATNGLINMILGGFSEEFPTLRSTRDNIHTLIKGPPKENPTCLTMKFEEKLSMPLQQSRTDPVVVSIKIEQM